MKRAFLIAWCALTMAAREGRVLAQATPSAPEGIAVGEFTLTPTLELRTRGEYRRDPVDLRTRDAWLIFERTRLGLGAERGALRAQVKLQDSRAWGAPSGFGVFAPFEAYAEARTEGARPSYLRIGRQTVAWGDGRLLGVSDWHPTARSLDAVRGHLAVGPVDVEALAALLDPPQPASASFGGRGVSGEATGTQLYGLLFGWAAGPLFRAELSALARVSRSFDTSVGNLAGNGDPASRFGVARAFGETYTGDLRVFGEGRGFRYGIEGAYQMGTARQLGLDRAAYAAGAYVGRTFDGVSLTPALRVGGSLASGDDTHGQYKQFDPLLSDVHTHYGAMDVFAWSNVAEVNAQVSLSPFTDVTFALEYRYARLMESSGEWLNNYLSNVGRAPGSREGELGHEGDAFFSFIPWSPLDLRAGYSLFLLGDGARTILASGGGETLSHFAYLQATLSVP